LSFLITFPPCAPVYTCWPSSGGVYEACDNRKSNQAAENVGFPPFFPFSYFLTKGKAISICTFGQYQKVILAFFFPGASQFTLNTLKKKMP
jgi:hypothetical protein